MALYFIFITPLIASTLSFCIKKKLGFLNVLAMAASTIELVAAIMIVWSVIKNGSYNLGEYFSVNALGAILLMILAVVGCAASWYSTAYLKVEVTKEIIGFRRVKQYFVLLHLFVLAMYFAVATTSPVLMWIAIEATTLSTAFLISFYNKPAAMEAAWKYLVINSVGLLLAFFGTLLFLYPSVRMGGEGLVSWVTLLANATKFDPFIAKIAFIFVIIGYGTKVGLVPMHTWLPDAHSKAPAPISSLLSGVLLNVAFLAILRFKSVVDVAVGVSFTQNILMYFGVISIVVAAFIIFIQKNYKRLLAYSSIEHMGIMALGFGFGGVGAYAAVLHMIYHALAKSILFLSAGNIFVKFSSTKLKNIKGVLSVLPVTGVLFLIGFLAITGMPPFGIFITEFMILSAGIHSHPVLVGVASLGIVLVFVGFLRHLTGIMFGESKTDVVKGEASVMTIIPILVLVVILIVMSIYIPSGVKFLISSAL